MSQINHDTVPDNLPVPTSEFAPSSNDLPPQSNEVDILKKQVALLESADPYKVVEMATSIASERRKAVDARKARDEAIQRLTDAYISVEEKGETIERLTKELELLKPSGRTMREAERISECVKLKAEIARLEGLVKDLRDEIKATKTHKDFDAGHSPASLQESPPSGSRTSDSSRKTILELEDDIFNFTVIRTAVPSEEAEDIIHARNKLLAAFPIPDEAPDDVLKPITIPPSYLNLTEFLASVPGPLRASLANYRVVNQLTTSWCPQREEHGYYLAPAFKCDTNPRVTTAHRWAPADVMSKMSKPTECFYIKDGVWYYAGVYKAFKLDDLTVKEWDALSIETTQAIVKETLEGRKNTSPQNTYEVSQLYAAGALKVAVIALQCVGFNHSMYRLLLEHANKCTLSAAAIEQKHTKSSQSQYGAATGNVKMIHKAETSLWLGLGSDGNIWNTNIGLEIDRFRAANDKGTGGKGFSGLTDAMEKMSISKNDNHHPQLARKGVTGNENNKPLASTQVRPTTTMKKTT